MRGLFEEMDSIKQDNSIAENKTERVGMDSRTGRGRKVIPDGMCRGEGSVSPDDGTTIGSRLPERSFVIFYSVSILCLTFKLVCPWRGVVCLQHHGQRWQATWTRERERERERERGRDTEIQREKQRVKQRHRATERERERDRERQRERAGGTNRRNMSTSCQSHDFTAASDRRG